MPLFYSAQITTSLAMLLQTTYGQSWVEGSTTYANLFDFLLMHGVLICITPVLSPSALLDTGGCIAVHDGIIQTDWCAWVNGEKYHGNCGSWFEAARVGIIKGLDLFIPSK